MKEVGAYLRNQRPVLASLQKVQSCFFFLSHSVYTRLTVNVYISYISNLIHLPLGKKSDELAQEATDSNISAAGTREPPAADS